MKLFELEADDIGHPENTKFVEREEKYERETELSFSSDKSAFAATTYEIGSQTDFKYHYKLAIYAMRTALLITVMVIGAAFFIPDFDGAIEYISITVLAYAWAGNSQAFSWWYASSMGSRTKDRNTQEILEREMDDDGRR